MKLDIYAMTNAGGRPVNEDAVRVNQSGDKAVVVVCDGLGGHAKGEVASEVVSEYIAQNLKPGEQSKDAIHKVMTDAQEALRTRQHEEHLENAMKTTCVVLSVDSGHSVYAHVGDSRGYVFKHIGKYARTIDHSVPQMLVLSGDIKEEEIRFHPDRSSVLRVFGSPWEKDVIEFGPEQALINVRAFLLCTDGFWELIDEETMKKCFKESGSAREWVEKMTEIVFANGKDKEMDNITAAAVIVRM